MSAAMVVALSWPTITLIVLFIQSLVIWRLRVRLRNLEQYEFWYFSQNQQAQQPRAALQPLRRPR